LISSLLVSYYFFPSFELYCLAPFAVSGPPKPFHKSGISSTTTTKGRHSSSPLPSPPQQSVPPASPLGSVNIPKSHATVEDLMPTPVKSKENAATSSDKEIPSRTTGAVRETPGRKRNVGATGDTIPNSGKKIEPIIKKVSGDTSLMLLFYEHLVILRLLIQS
jgi:hypothetical protein